MQMGLIIDAEVLRIQRLFVSRPRTRPRLLSQGEDQDQDQDFCLKAKTKTKTKTKTDTLIFVLEALRGQDFVLEDDITARCTTNVQD